MDRTAPIQYDAAARRGVPNQPRPYGVPSLDAGDSDWATSGALWSLDAVLRIFVCPVSFFQDRRSGCAVPAAASFCITHAVVLTVCAFAADLLGAALIGTAATDPAEAIRTIGLLAMTAFTVGLASLAASFGAAALLHPVAILVRGSGGFGATYAALAYAWAPAGTLYVLGRGVLALAPSGAVHATGAAIAVWLTVAGVIWSVALLGLALREMH
ncbi:MAG: hypothetical protein FJX72_07555 [Armatimonadetes bacterium]|nr:hypothetical protein [Armatimonadota bacterium]